jgi:hypothetical protein
MLHVQPLLCTIRVLQQHMQIILEFCSLTQLLHCCCTAPHTQAQELASLLRHYNLMSHVNLIPWNPVDDSPYKRPGSSKVWPLGSRVCGLKNTNLYI